VSGDFVKAYYVSKESQGRGSRALSSIIFDRVAGVSALVLISAFAMVSSRGTDWSQRLLDALEIFVVASGLGVIAFYGYLYLLKDKHDVVGILLQSVERRYPKFGSVKRSYEGIRVYRSCRGTVLSAFVISLLIHALVILACAFFARALGEHDLVLHALFVVVPLGLLVTAIPVTPAGVGTGHAAFTGLFHLLGSNAGANVFNFFLIHQLVFGGLGGLLYLRFKQDPGMAFPAAQPQA
jgi:uncharacterized protein (TIRG00374 family)